MSRRFLPAIWAFTLLFLMMQVPAMAASYVVAPFSVSGAQGYSYLGQAVPSMLTSRLYLQGQFEPVGRQDAALKEKAPSSRESASAMARKFGADYVIWGSITVMGDQASLDVSALSPDGKVWKEAATSQVNALIGGLQNVADAINIEVFGRTDVTRAGAAAGSPSSAFLMNETRGSVQNGAYLNPSLRYQGTEDNRSQIRSQMLGFECIGMEVGDINRDGKNEILLLNDNTLNAYVWQNGNKLVEIGEYRLPSSMKPVLVRIYTQDKKTYVLLSGYDKGDTAAYAFYESPKRIMSVIDFFIEENAQLRLCLCNDMTKLHEMTFRGTPQEVKDQLIAKETYEKGEYALIVEVCDDYRLREVEHITSPEALLVDCMVRSDCTAKDAIKMLLKDENNTYSKNELYAAHLALKERFGA